MIREFLIGKDFTFNKKGEKVDKTEKDYNNDKKG